MSNELHLHVPHFAVDPQGCWLEQSRRTTIIGRLIGGLIREEWVKTVNAEKIGSTRTGTELHGERDE